MVYFNSARSPDSYMATPTSKRGWAVWPLVGWVTVCQTKRICGDVLADYHYIIITLLSGLVIITERLINIGKKTC